MSIEVQNHSSREDQISRYDEYKLRTQINNRISRYQYNENFVKLFIHCSLLIGLFGTDAVSKLHKENKT